ncbi:hypothetical protein INT43_005560 [Umbelopsis isabellina]|uniref:DUF866-domain-containing protein n=1 Tax=Mortierella isabellina TaxID=91625 RepID=A0A8H7PNC0_MORIS|nr:hypothetical protein INT43_005560 [Umbelopsis isabellina]
MVKIGVYIKAELENVTDLRPVSDYEWHFKIQCSSCHETDENWITINAQDEVEVPGSKATANLVMKCKFCRRTSSASFEGSTGSYSIDQVRQFVKLAVLDCRGLEPVDFDPRDGWLAEGAESGTKFEDIDLTEKDWAEYDEKAGEPVGISGIEVDFRKEK